MIKKIKYWFVTKILKVKPFGILPKWYVFLCHPLYSLTQNIAPVHYSCDSYTVRICGVRFSMVDLFEIKHMKEGESVTLHRFKNDITRIVKEV